LRFLAICAADTCEPVARDNNPRMAGGPQNAPDRAGCITRREAIRKAAALGAALAWAPGLVVAASQRPRWTERRECYPQGVASGDPRADGVLLWTRRPPEPDGPVRRLVVDIARDPEFDRIVAQARAIVSPDTDWTCRVLAAGLTPNTDDRISSRPPS